MFPLHISPEKKYGDPMKRYEAYTLLFNTSKYFSLRALHISLKSLTHFPLRASRISPKESHGP